MEIIIQKLNEIELIVKKQIISTRDILTLDEASEYLQLSKSCLYKMTSSKEIPYYVPGGKKIYFKKTELEEWLFKSRVTPMSEIFFKDQKYLLKNSKI